MSPTMVIPTPGDTAVAFLKALDPDGWHNLVAADPAEKRSPWGRTFAPGDWTGIKDFVDIHEGVANLYFSANEPKAGAPNKKLNKDDVAALRVLYADIDPAKDADFSGERRRLSELDGKVAVGMMPATFSIDSGGGVQLLWRLSAKLPVDETSQAWAESFGRGIAEMLGGDKVQNIDRVLRLPGTTNLPTEKKRARGRVAAPARLVRSGLHVYDRATIEARVTPALSVQRHDSDALVSAAAAEIAGEDFGVTDDLRKRFDAALEKHPKLHAVWNGDPAGLAGPDDSGSGWRGSLARRMAEVFEANFSGLDYARMVHAWTHSAIDPDKLTDRNLARDWGRCGAPFSAEVQAAQFLDPVDDDAPETVASTGAAASGGTSPIDFDSLTVVSPDEFHAIPDREFILGSRFQPGTLTIGVGPPGASKSTFGILSALAIETGKPLTGEYVSVSGPVLIYTAEDPKLELVRRVSAIARRHGLNVPDVIKRVRLLSGYDGKRLIFAEREGRNGLIRPGPDLAAFTEFVRRTGIVHVVLDPMISLHRGLDENSSSDMEALGDYLRQFARQSGASVDLIHHTVKNRQGQPEQSAGMADSARGSSAVIGYVRSAYTLVPMSSTTAKELGLPPERASQMVRLDDAKRNYSRRTARERWFELVSVLPTGEAVSALDFEATDRSVVRRALSSVGVHIPFDANRQRALQNLAKGNDDAERVGTMRSYIVSSMAEDWIERPALVGMMSSEMGIGATTARNTIDELIPFGRARALSVEGEGLVYDVWREKRKIGSAWKWIVCRHLTGQNVRLEPEPEAPEQAHEGVFA